MKLGFPKFKSNSQSRATSTENIKYLGVPNDLAFLPVGKCVILSELVVMNLEQPVQMDNYVSQPIRQCARNDISLASLTSTFSGNNTILHSSIHQSLAGQVTNSTKHNYILAVDAFIAYAARQRKSDVLLICSGYEVEEKTFFDTYLFKHGQLIRITEAELKPVTNPRYMTDVRNQIEEAISDYTSARIIWTPPLTPIDLHLPGHKVEIVGNEIFKGRFPAITKDGKVTTSVQKKPLFATLAVLTFCISWGAYDVYSFQQARDSYQKMLRQSETETIDLTLLQNRANWQTDSDLAGSDILKPAANFLSAVANKPELKITSMDLKTSRGSDASSAVNGSKILSPMVFVVTAPNHPSIPSLDQVHPIITDLKNQTGLNLFVGQQGISSGSTDSRLKISIDADK